MARLVLLGRMSVGINRNLCTSLAMTMIIHSILVNCEGNTSSHVFMYPLLRGDDVASFTRVVCSFFDLSSIWVPKLLIHLMQRERYSSVFIVFPRPSKHFSA